MKTTLKKAIESYLENVKAFRDYQVKPLKDFKTIMKRKDRVLCYQIRKSEALETQLEEAVTLFCENGFSSIVFYI